jgi:hypothetical protein
MVPEVTPSMDGVGKPILTSEYLVTDDIVFSRNCCTEQYGPHSPKHAKSQV